MQATPQKEQTQSTTVRSPRTRRQSNYQGNRVAMLAAKNSAIPVPLQDFDNKLGIIKWGNRNEYPYFLNYLKKSNPIHGGILNAKTYFTVSGGLIYEGADSVGYEDFYKNKKSGFKDKNLEEVTNDISKSFERANVAFVKIDFSTIGERIYRKMEVIPFETVRFGAFEKNGQLYLDESIKISPNWFNDKVTPIKLFPYNPSDPDQRVCYAIIMEDEGQSLDDPSKFKDINPCIYPSPPYEGAIVSIDTGIQTIQWGNSEIHNGFSLGSLLYFGGGYIKDEDERKRFERDLGLSTTGPLQAGRAMAVYGKGQDQRPEVLPLNGNNLPDRYTNAKRGAEESTVQGHSLTVPMLAGVKTEGSLGNATELEIGYQIFKQNYIVGRQDRILSLLNWIMNEIAGIQGTLTFGDVKLNLEAQVQVDESSLAAAALNGMSPLVATKVLSAMTQNEIRNLAKLIPIDGGDELPQPANSGGSAFKSGEKDVILERLKKAGTDRAAFNVIHSMGADGLVDKDSMLADLKSSFADLSETALKVLGLINSDESYESIRSVLDLTTSEINSIYNNLEGEALIDADGAITTEGKRAAAIAEVESITVMYSYELRPDAPALVAGGESREFCQELMALNRLYSREDIGIISGIEGYDVFAYRGGWYHNPNTNKNEPGCRHRWTSNLVFKN